MIFCQILEIPSLEVLQFPFKNPVPVSRFPHIPISSDKSPCLKQTYGVHFQSFCLEFLETLAPFRSESLLSGTLTSGIRISRPKTGHSSSASCTRGIEETQDGEGYIRAHQTTRQRRHHRTRRPR